METKGCEACGMKGFCGVQTPQDARPNPRAIVLAYVIPLLLLLAGVVVGSALGDIWALGGGLAPVALWYLLVLKRL